MSFRSILGQERAVAALRGALAAGRVPHAYLFVGPVGVGKLTTALELAKALVCTAGEDDACDACGACVKAAHGTHPDIYRIEPEGAGRQIKIGVFRDRETGEGLIKDLGLKPNEAARNVALIDDAHAMNIESANCFLKTLEEPPPTAVLVLVTARPDALPETIVSRCQAVQFRPLAADVIRGKLEAHGCESGLAEVLARWSGGSLGRAMAMAAQPELRQLRRTVLDIVTRLEPSNIIEQAGRLLKLVRERSESLAEARTVAGWLLDFAVLFYRDVVLRQVSVAGEGLSSNDMAELLESETAISRLGIRAILDTIEEAKRLLDANVNLDAVVADAFSRIAYYRSRRAATAAPVIEPRRGT